MNFDDARAKIDAILEGKTSILVAEIKRMIIDRPFVLDRGITKDQINGIHFEYEWDSFLPIACPLNTITGYCGAGEPLALFERGEDQLFPTSIEEDCLNSVAATEHESIERLIHALQTERYREWFLASWKLARDVNPSMRGFWSVHDSIWRTDLDTGEKFEEDSGRVKFF